MNDTIKKEDMLLLFLYVKGTSNSFNEPIIGRTRLVKLLYIFKEDFIKIFNKDNELISEDKFHEFFNWKFGPMSKDILQDLEFFKKINFIKVDNIPESNNIEDIEEYNFIANESSVGEDGDYDYFYEKYSLTLTGKKYVENILLGKVSNQQILIISSLKKQFNSMSLSEILRFVYNKHPESTTKSIIREKYLS